MKELELCGKIEISCIKDIETGKLKLMVWHKDPNDLDQYFFIEEVILGQVKVIAYNI